MLVYGVTREHPKTASLEVQYLNKRKDEKMGKRQRYLFWKVFLRSETKCYGKKKFRGKKNFGN